MKCQEPPQAPWEGKEVPEAWTSEMSWGLSAEPHREGWGVLHKDTKSQVGDAGGTGGTQAEQEVLGPQAGRGARWPRPGMFMLHSGKINKGYWFEKELGN